MQRFGQWFIQSIFCSHEFCCYELQSKWTLEAKKKNQLTSGKCLLYVFPFNANRLACFVYYIWKEHERVELSLKKKPLLIYHFQYSLELYPCFCRIAVDGEEILKSHWFGKMWLLSMSKQKPANNATKFDEKWKGLDIVYIYEPYQYVKKMKLNVQLSMRCMHNR